MLARVYAIGLLGVEGFEIEVEADLRKGLPAFELVGLPDMAIREARERVRAAILNSGFEFPLQRLIVNLAPGNRRKEGSAYDLAIALAVLAATGFIRGDSLSHYYLVGELALDGTLKPVRGVLAMALAASRWGRRRLLVPAGNGKEAAAVPGIKAFPVSSLQEAVSFLNGGKTASPAVYAEAPASPSPVEVDLEEIQGQEGAKRALEIAAAGGHNLLMVGPPGTGKTLLARAMPGLLPSMTWEETLEVNTIYSVAGLVNADGGLLRCRPFRSPHHSCTVAGLIGGGTYPRPGELSLAHNGVLFLDELPEFRREVIEALRQPLEDGVVTLARGQITLTFPARVLLLAGMNPCKCGFLGDPNHPCRCRPGEIHAYLGRISGPLLDRFDLFVEVPRPPATSFFAGGSGERSAAVQARVEAARQRQLRRLAESGLRTNAAMGPRAVKRFCRLEPEGEAFLQGALRDLGWGMRACHRVLKVARTLADLAGEERIDLEHLAEAVQLRRLVQQSAA